MSELTADRIAFQPRPSVRPADSEGLSPRQLVALFARNWRLILCFGLVSASSYLASKTLLTQKFTADAMVEVEMGGFAIPELQGVIGSETSDALTFVRSELQVLTSRALVQAVIEELNLTADPEFNAALQGPSLKVRIGGAIRDRLPAAFAARLVAGGILPSAHAPPPSPDVVMANVVAAVTNEIGIIIDGKTLLMGVNFSSEQADIASAFVNSLITRYMAGKVNERAVADRKANADLESAPSRCTVKSTSLSRRLGIRGRNTNSCRRATAASGSSNSGTCPPP